MVRINEDDISAISRLMNISELEFIQNHTRLRPSREGLALQEREDGSCIFLGGTNTCTIQDAKPHQCRGFPNVWNFPGWREQCEAVEISSDNESRT
jgi:Fe-S-cluster containining protein